MSRPDERRVPPVPSLESPPRWQGLNCCHPDVYQIDFVPRIQNFGCRRNYFPSNMQPNGVPSRLQIVERGVPSRWLIWLPNRGERDPW